MEIIIILTIVIVVILIIRLLGSWMLRIDVVINNQKAIITELKKLNKK